MNDLTLAEGAPQHKPPKLNVCFRFCVGFAYAPVFSVVGQGQAGSICRLDDGAVAIQIGAFIEGLFFGRAGADILARPIGLPPGARTTAHAANAGYATAANMHTATAIENCFFILTLKNRQVRTEGPSFSCYRLCPSRRTLRSRTYPLRSYSSKKTMGRRGR